MSKVALSDEIISAWIKLQKQKPKLAKGAKRTKEFIEKSKSFGADQANFMAKIPEGMRTTAAGKKIKKNKLIKVLTAAAAKKIEANRQEELAPPSGTRDFDPQALRQRNWLFSKFRDVGHLFGFEEYDAPVLEKQRLYTLKAGDAGEEIIEQMYAFTDKEGKEVTLRPEMTPTLARMVLQKQQYQSGVIQALMPLKWFTVAQCWRFESCQRGRKREHYQWNMDIVGVEGVEAELELLASIGTFFSSIGVGPEIVGLKVNSRKILQSLINSYGITDDNQFTKVCVIVDKLDKIGDCAVLEELAKIDVSDETGKSLLRALKSKSIEELNKVCGARLDKAVVEEMMTVFKVAKEYMFEGKSYRLSDYLEFDASVVRGLAYYTGIVFEGFDRQGWKLRAICGGGRYDNLISLYGSKKRVPCCGFGFGDCVIIELLKEMNAMPKTPRAVDYVVAYYNTDLFGAANQVASVLRASGKTVNLMLQKKDAKSSFSFADRAGASRCAFVAPDEWGDAKTPLKDRHVRIKDLTNSDMTDKGVDIPFLELGRADSYFTDATSDAAVASAGASPPVPASASPPVPASAAAVASPDL